MQPDPKGPCPPPAPRPGHAGDKCEYVVRQLGMAWLLWLLVRHHLCPCLPWESKREAGVRERAECVFPHPPPTTQSCPALKGLFLTLWASIAASSTGVETYRHLG